MSEVQACQYCRYFDKDVQEEPCCQCEKAYTSKFESARVIDVLKSGDIKAILGLANKIGNIKSEDEMEEFLNKELY